MSRSSFFILCIVCAFIAGFAYLFFEIQKIKQAPLVANNTNNSLTQTQGSVDYNQVQNYIDQKLASLGKLSSPIPSQSPSTVPQSISTPIKSKQVTYIPISNSASTTETEWKDVSGSDFYIALQDYPNVSSVTFEATIKISNGGAAYARLFDVTHSIAVNGSEISTQNTEYKVESSGSLNLWSGNNLYRVQIKSLNSQAASFASGRVKIIY